MHRSGWNKPTWLRCSVAPAAACLAGALLLVGVAEAQERRAAKAETSGASRDVLLPAQQGFTGVVRDLNGAARMGALVEVLSHGSRVVATAFTDVHGRYTVPDLAPGSYLVRASAALAVPASRGNLQLTRGSHSVVNLTLTALFDPASWLPAERRHADEAVDDWKWTLRSSANRPILRAVDDEVATATPEAATRPAVHGREMIGASSGEFGLGGVHEVLALQQETGTRRAGLRADLTPGAGQREGAGGRVDVSATLDRQARLGASSRVIARYTTQSGLSSEAGTPAALAVFEVAGSERWSLGDRVEVEAGSRMEGVQLAGIADFESQPFLRVTAHPAGSWRLEYRLASDRNVQSGDDLSASNVEVPAAQVRDAHLALQRGRHQEFSATRKTARSSVAVAVYHDRLENTAVNGLLSGTPATDARSAARSEPVQMLVDPVTGTFRALAGGYSTTGARVSVSAPVSSGMWIAAEYSTGQALGMAAAGRPSAAVMASPLQAVNSLTARSSQTGVLAVESRLVRSGTRARASYRWQTGATVTAVDPFSSFSSRPYLSLLMQQPIRLGSRLPSGLYATIDVTNLLAQGYRPFLSADGQTLYFAQSPRTVQAGLAFSF